MDGLCTIDVGRLIEQIALVKATLARQGWYPEINYLPRNGGRPAAIAIRGKEEWNFSTFILCTEAYYGAMV